MKNKIKKILLPVSVTIVLLIIGTYIFIVSQLTAVYPPVKEYILTATVPGLKRKMLDLFKDKVKYTHVFTDTTGDNETGYAYYGDLRIDTHNKKYEYQYKYLQNAGVWRTEGTSKIELIGAFNLTDSLGGYKKEDEGMKDLVEIFDKEFIEKLK